MSLSIESWLKVACPHCAAKNWLYNGRDYDETSFSAELCRCWSCEKRFFLDEEESRAQLEGRTAETCHEEEKHEGAIEDCEDCKDCEYKTWSELVEDYHYEWGRKNPDDRERLH